MYLEKLKDIAPTLHKLKTKGSGYTLPSGYFRHVEDTVIFTLKAGKIDVYKNKSSVPENYFETFEDRIFNKLNENKAVKKSSKVIFLRKQIITRFVPIAVAASFILFLAINYFGNSKISINNVSSTTVDSWINEDLIPLNSYEIASAYTNVNLDDNNSFELLNKNQISNYFNDTDTDIEDLILEN